MRSAGREVAEPPAGHRERLREAVDGDGAVFHPVEGAERGGFEAVVDDLLVDLVRDDRDIVFDREVADALQRTREYTAPWGLPGELTTSSSVSSDTASARSSSAPSSWKSWAAVSTRVSVPPASFAIAS